MSLEPYYSDDAVTIYCGDCRGVLPALGPVDAVVTDPPYDLDIAQGNKGCFAKSYGKLTSTPLQAIAGSFDIEWLVSEWARLMSPVSAFVFCSNAQVSRIMAATEARGWSTTLLVWNKYNSVPFSHGTWRQDAEFIVHAKTSGAALNGDSEVKRKITTLPINPSRFGHPTEKPLDLIEKYVIIGSEPGATVLDPYMGSGTTLVAAKNLGRKAIGIEIEERYCEIAAERCRQEVLAL